MEGANRGLGNSSSLVAMLTVYLPKWLLDVFVNKLHTLGIVAGLHVPVAMVLKKRALLPISPLPLSTGSLPAMMSSR